MTSACKPPLVCGGRNAFHRFYKLTSSSGREYVQCQWCGLEEDYPLLPAKEET